MLVSIITPTFNSEIFIKDTYQSIKSQSYSNWNWIVVDDCSTDGTVKILESLMLLDNRIQLFRNITNLGAAVTRNRAIEKATGRFIAFLDSDDLWSNDKLEKQISFMNETKIAFSYSAYSIIDEAGKDTKKIIDPPNKLDYPTLLKENQIGCLTAIYDQEILGKCYMPLIRKRQDYGLWLSVLKKTPYAYKVPGVLAVYRIRNESVSSSKINLLQYNYRLFREFENLSVFKSVYYLSWNVLRKIFK
ncbi:glycosyltransferase family 2 protein [Arenibacter palladensis]|uniref:glycosyltransferase family 2 protein n=1 Tax=Arenibacter palladensis TaxID=237373 RepID=UPI002FD1048B